MKLVGVWNAKESWSRLAMLRLPPRTSYRILKYLDVFDAEYALIDKERTNLIHQAVGSEGDGFVQLTPGSPEHMTFVRSFTAFLETESAIQSSDMKFDELLAVLESHKDNTVSAADLAALEPFFSP